MDRKKNSHLCTPYGSTVLSSLRTGAISFRKFLCYFLLLFYFFASKSSKTSLPKGGTVEEKKLYNTTVKKL